MAKLFALFSLAALAACVPLEPRQAAPQVALPYGTFQGKTQPGYNGKLVNSFLGIPFAQPPTGNLRLRYAVTPPNTLSGVQDATNYGPSCPQMSPFANRNSIPSALLDQIQSLPLLQAVSTESEDCLTINVEMPNGLASGTQLPVLVWIYGGGFEFGSTSMYPGFNIVARSMEINEPVIFVSMNYRLAAWGFLGSAEVRAEGVGNIGLDDQRTALRWVQQYISKFNGDPSKVTIWGESAGAISVALQMLTAGGSTENLFRAAFMNSGSPIPVGKIEGGQPYYDSIVQSTGCSGASNTLDCLRTVPEAQFKAAVDQTPGIFSYQSLDLAYLPRVDGKFLTEPPQYSVRDGNYAKIPMVSGDCDDEGTLFALPSLNVTTDSQAVTYAQMLAAPNATPEEIATVAALYPSSPPAGSPFDTGYLNAVTPEFKRIAAVLGDYVFQAPRRYFLQTASSTQNVWSFLHKRLKATPVLGAFHSSDLFSDFFLVGGLVDSTFVDYLINFTNNLDPNQGASVPAWQQYKNSTGSQMKWLNAASQYVDGQDTYRKDAMAYLTYIALKYPIGGT